MGDGDTKGAGELKVEWNNHTLNVTLPTIYGELLESFTKSSNMTPSDCYSLWPDMRVVTSPFDRLAKGLVTDVIHNSRKVFWCEMANAWCCLQEVLLENPQTRHAHVNCVITHTITCVGLIHLVF